MSVKSKILQKSKQLSIHVLLALFLCALIPLAPLQALHSTEYELLGTHPQAAAQSTATGRTIHELEVFNNKVFAGYGDYGANTGPIHINPYDLSSENFLGSQLSVPTEAILRYRVLNGDIYAPTTDPNGTPGYARGEPWANAAGPTGVHLFDIAMNGADIWMSGSATSVEAAGAHVWRSTDGGDTWQIMLTEEAVGASLERYYWIAELNGTMYAQARGIPGNTSPIKGYNGSSWDTITATQFVNESNFTVERFGDVLVGKSAIEQGIAAFDGSSVEQITSLYGDARDLYVDGDYLYVLRTNGTLTRTNNLESWQELGTVASLARSLSVSDGVVYLGTTDSKIYASTTALPSYVPDLRDTRILPAPLFVSTTTGGDDALSNPSDTAVDDEGNVYVVDTSNNRVQKFSPNGEFMGTFGTFGTANGNLHTPREIVIGADDNLYVSDRGSGTGRVQKFSPDGTFQEAYAVPALEGSIDIDSDGNIYVLDQTGGRTIKKYNTSGTQLQSFGTSGTGNGQWSVPVDFVLDSNDDIYVVDQGNRRIQKFSNAGTYSTKWGVEGEVAGAFITPTGITVDQDNNVYVVDNGNNRIQMFTAAGVFRTQWGEAGTDDGQFSSPQSISIAPDRSMYVVDQDNARIQKFAYNMNEVLRDDKILLTTPFGTNITCATNVLERNLAKRDRVYKYPHGLVDFCLEVESGSTQQISVTFITGQALAGIKPRKYDASQKKYMDIPGVTLTKTRLNDRRAVRITYSVTDGGSLDDDGQVNGQIRDPVGIGVLQDTTASVGLAATGDSITPAIQLVFLLLGLGVVFHKYAVRG